MYIEKEGNEFLVINESGHVIASRKSINDANRFIDAQKKKRTTKNSRRQERVSYSSRDDE